MPWKLSRELFAFSVIATIVVLALVLGPTLPEQVPTHFDFHGNPDDYSSRSGFLFMVVGMAVGMYLLLTFLPMIDPFWPRIKHRYHLLMLFRDFILGFELVLCILTFVASHEGRLPLNMLGVTFGVLFAFMGNYLPKVPRNWFFGIRTPWTLASDVVWQKTHIVGGWMLTIAGILLAVLSLLGVPLHIGFLTTIIPTAIISGFVYPFLLYRRLQKSNAPQTEEQI